MIRATDIPRPLCTGSALLGAAAMVTLAGCSGGTTAAANPEASTPAPAASTAATSSAESTTAGEASTYKDGSYQAEGDYIDGGGQPETVKVTVTLAGDTVTAVEVTGSATSGQSQQYQSKFIGGISDVVVGHDIDELQVSRVSGSSLTSTGFNAAIEKIKQEAKA